MSQHRRNRKASLIRACRVGLALAVGLLGCGGSGGGSSPVPCASLFFAPALAAPAAGDVFLQEATATCSTVDVNVLISNLSGIWTVGFDLTFPAAFLNYQSFMKGPLLLKGNPTNPPAFFVTNPSSGHLQVFMTRFASDPSVAAGAGEVLITLRFSKVASGAGAIDFDTVGGIPEQILDENAALRPASFAPGHGGVATVP